MAGTEARIGFGCLLKIGDAASPQTFNAIAQVRNLGNFGAERALIDKTNFDSPFFMEYILAMPDGSEMAVTCNFLPNNPTQNSTTGLIKAMADAVEREFQLLIRDSYSLAEVGTFSFSGLPRAWNVPIETNTLMEITFAIKLTGFISYSAA